MRADSILKSVRPDSGISPRIWARILLLARARQKSRQDLSKLDDRLLQDIGLTREMATEEAGKPIWRD